MEGDSREAELRRTQRLLPAWEGTATLPDRLIPFIVFQYGGLLTYKLTTKITMLHTFLHKSPFIHGRHTVKGAAPISVHGDSTINTIPPRGLTAPAFVMSKATEAFYWTDAWKQCRQSYAQSKQWLCERCLSRGIYTPGVIVHHKKHITPKNITDPNVTLNWNNLQLLCRDCHAQMHRGGVSRYKVDELGRVTIME